MVISNTNMIVGGQGYCVFEFTLSDQIGGYSDVQIELAPQYDPNETATAQTSLENVWLNAPRVGKRGAKVTAETDCNVTGFDVVQGSGTYNGEGVDLVNSQEVEAGSGDLPITVGGN